MSFFVELIFSVFRSLWTIHFCIFYPFGFIDTVFFVSYGKKKKIVVIFWMVLMTGSTALWSHFLDDLLGLMVQQKRLILSDKKFLSSFMTSLLSSSCNSLLVPESIGQRYSTNFIKLVGIIMLCSFLISWKYTSPHILGTICKIIDFFLMVLLNK